jgi:hypothetical protein
MYYLAISPFSVESLVEFYSRHMKAKTAKVLGELTYLAIAYVTFGACLLIAVGIAKSGV